MKKKKRFTAPYIPHPGIRWRSGNRFMPYWLSSNTIKVILGLLDAVITIV